MKLVVRTMNRKLWGKTVDYSFGSVSFDERGYAEIDESFVASNPKSFSVVTKGSDIFLEKNKDVRPKVMTAIEKLSSRLLKTLALKLGISMKTVNTVSKKQLYEQVSKMKDIDDKFDVIKDDLT